MGFEQGARGLQGRPTRRLTFNLPLLALHSPALRAGAGKSGVRGDEWKVSSMQIFFAKSSRSACIVRPMHRQGCRYCSLTSEEVAYNASYCSGELLLGRPRQRRHSTPSLNRILAVRYDTTQHNVPRKHVPQDGRRVRSILLPPLQSTSLTNFQAAFYSVSAAQH